MEQFNRAKLEAVYAKLGMREEITKEDERLVNEELERCKDSYYFYLNYWTVDGKRPELTREEFNSRMEAVNMIRGKRKNIIANIHELSNIYPKTIKEVYKLIDNAPTDTQQSN